MKRESGGGEEIIDLRGEVFEDYAASIIKRALSDTGSLYRAIHYSSDVQIRGNKRSAPILQSCGDDTLILLECKAPLLSAKTKFSGDFCNLYDGIKPNAIKGVEQLCTAIQTLGHTDATQRRRVEGIDIPQVRKIYPVLVLSDRMFSFPFMNRFLDSEFQRLATYNDLQAHLEIMPLTILTIEDLESLEPYLSDTPHSIRSLRRLDNAVLFNK